MLKLSIKNGFVLWNIKAILIFAVKLPNFLKTIEKLKYFCVFKSQVKAYFIIYQSPP